MSVSGTAFATTDQSGRLQQAVAAPVCAELLGVGLPLPLPAARWQSFGSPPDAPELVLLSDGLLASAPGPVELLPTLPFILLPPVAFVPDAPPPLPDDVPPLELPEAPELPEDWAMADVARARASADVARIFKIMSFTFMVWIVFAGPKPQTSTRVPNRTSPLRPCSAPY